MDKRISHLLIGLVFFAIGIGMPRASRDVVYSTYSTPVQTPTVQTPPDSPSGGVQGVNRLESRTERFRVTAYCADSCCCGDWADGYFADGSCVWDSEFAIAAPRGIALGTMISVPGYNDGEPVRVRDRGGAIKSGKLDVFFNDIGVKGEAWYISGHDRALLWGVQYLDCEVTL